MGLHNILIELKYYHNSYDTYGGPSKYTFHTYYYGDQIKISYVDKGDGKISQQFSSTIGLYQVTLVDKNCSKVPGSLYLNEIELKELICSKLLGDRKKLRNYRLEHIGI